MFDRFDRAGRRVLEAAWDEATSLGDDAVGTECLLIALASSDTTTATLLAESGVSTSNLRRHLVDQRHPSRRADHQTRLSRIGIDLAEVRRRAEQTFGADAVARAASTARTRRPRPPLGSYVSCSRPPRNPRCESPLAGQRLAPIPRVKRVLKRAARAARPRLASASHLLLALLEGNEPACELLTARGVDLSALADATRRSTGLPVRLS